MKIRSCENGPNMVETDEPLGALSGGLEKPLRIPIYLCRCGQSKNKPSCDGSHLSARFEAAGTRVLNEEGVRKRPARAGPAFARRGTGRLRLFT